MTSSILSPVLSEHWDEPDAWTLDGYLRHGGYRGLRTALGMDPDAVIALVKEAGLRGRGGAGFPTGAKWSFIPQGDGKPHYLVVNADESEPGTCKDIPLMLATPHTLIEGIVIAAFAIRASQAFIYVRGEVISVIRRLHAAVAQAYKAGYLGRNILDSGFDLELVVHAGAGAYICGKRPRYWIRWRGGADSLGCDPIPGRCRPVRQPDRGQQRRIHRECAGDLAPRRRMVPHDGNGKVAGIHALLVVRACAYARTVRAPLGVTLRQLLELAGGVRDGRALKFWTPGGSSTPLFTAEQLDVPLDYEGVSAAGSMLGTKALQIFDDTTCVVRAVLRWTEFYAHESCGKCTPCREGTYWLVRILQRLESGEGKAEDLDKLLDISDIVLGKSFCALGDGAASPIMSS